MTVVELVQFICAVAIEDFGDCSNQELSEILGELLLGLSLGQTEIKLFVLDNLVQVILETEHMLGVIERNTINLFWGYSDGIYSCGS